MILAIDIGNSAIKAGVFHEGALTEVLSPATALRLSDMLAGKSFTHAVISSVDPEQLDAVRQVAAALKIRNRHVLTTTSKFHFKIMYDTPQTLGVDRLCGLEGAFDYLLTKEKMQNLDVPVITIDCGTATTINIAVNGAFIGGLIIPGVTIMLRSLVQNTAQLPLADLTKDIPLIGMDTNSCIASGIVNSTTAAIEKVYKEITYEHKKKPRVFITGGNRAIIINNLTIPHTHVEELNLLGIFSAGHNEELY
jgi:type III pantothenate kinase